VKSIADVGLQNKHFEFRIANLGFRIWGVNNEELERGTKEFARRVARFVAALPKNKMSDVLGYQLFKAGTSVGANYREANRAVSRSDFINKISIVEKEPGESQYWLELCDEADIGEVGKRRWLLKESGELLAIFTTIGKTSKARRDQIRNPRSEIRD